MSHTGLRLWDPATPFSCWTSHLTFSGGELEGPRGPFHTRASEQVMLLGWPRPNCQHGHGRAALSSDTRPARAPGRPAQLPGPSEPQSSSRPVIQPAPAGSPPFLLAVTTSHSHDHQLIGLVRKGSGGVPLQACAAAINAEKGRRRHSNRRQTVSP